MFAVRNREMAKLGRQKRTRRSSPADTSCAEKMIRQKTCPGVVTDKRGETPVAYRISGPVQLPDFKLVPP